MTLPPRLPSIFRPRAALVIFLASCLLTQVTANVKSVQTFKEVGPLFGQLVTSSTLQWESYTGDQTQLEYAVEGGRFITEEEHYPIFVCRAIMDGIFVSGHTEKRQQKTVCLVSMHMEVRTHHAFEILINRGHGGKLIWTKWTKFTPRIPKGAVSATGLKWNDAYVARHKTKQHQQHTNGEEHFGADYNLGRFDPSDVLGKVIVSEGNREMEYEDGEVLVEVEPVRYELREIKIDKWRTDIKVNQTYLGSAVLSNTDDVPRLVETVISYNFDKVQNWGVHEGVARGLSTKVYEGGRLTNEVQWGLKHSDKIVETKTVSTNLKPGTALNVTLFGNYTTLDAPYAATLVAYYADNDDSISRKISATVQKNDMQNIKFEFSPVYWIENGTLLPTTTTTTTTTTTEPTTTSTREPEPVYSPPLVHVANVAASPHDDVAVAASKKNPNDIEDMHIGNSVEGEPAAATNAGGDSLKLTNLETNPADSAKASANSQYSQQQQSLVILLTSCLIASLLFLHKSVTSLN